MRASVRKMGFSVEQSFLLQIAKEAGGDWGCSHVSIANAPRKGGERLARFWAIDYVGLRHLPAIWFG